MGLVFHFQDKDTFYRFRMTDEQQQWSLTRLINGQVTTLFETQSSFSKNLDYLLRIETWSRQSESIGLKQKQTAKGAGKPAQSFNIDDMLKRAAQSSTITTIKIWINDSLWCVVEDKQQALSTGYIGLDSWWNNGARFDDIKVYKRMQSEIALGQTLSAEQLRTLSAHLSASEVSANEVSANEVSSETPDFMAVFSDFNAQDIAAAMQGAGDFSVAMAARVRVFDQAVFNMLGAMSADGHFILMTTTGISPFALSVAGIDLPLSVEVSGRMSLEGKSAGAESYALIQANVYGDWALIASSRPDEPVARLLLASEAEPASLRLASNLDFTLQGSGDLQLFSQQVIIHGEVDISQAHIMIAGELEFKPDIILMQNTRLMELVINCKGRIGPGQLIELEGEGQLVLMGKSFSTVSARLGYQQIEMSASLNGSNQNWQLGLLNLSKVQMQLTGQVDFRESDPFFAFNGEGKFDLFGVQVEGQCRIEADNQHWLLANSGRIFWQGRNWLDGEVILSDEGVQLQGKADFSINLTPQPSLANIQIAGLHLNAAISGMFTLNNQGQLINWQFDLDWQLAIQLPDTEEQQAFPIATQKLKLEDSYSGTNDIFELADLITVDGLTLFNFENISIPVPTIDFDNGTNVYLHDSVDIDIDGAGGLSVPLPTPFKPAANSVEIGEVAFIKFYDLAPGINLPELTVPVPMLSTEKQATNDSPLFTLPAFGASSQPLGQIRLDQVKFNLKLAWKEGKLGILDAEEDKFTAFDELPFVMLRKKIINLKSRLFN